MDTTTTLPTDASQMQNARKRFLRFSHRFALFSWTIFAVGLSVYAQSLPTLFWMIGLGLLVAFSQYEVLTKGYLVTLILAAFATAWGVNTYMQTEADNNQYRLMASMMKSGSVGFQQASSLRVKDGKVSKQDFRLMAQDFARGDGVMVGSIHPATAADRAEFFRLVGAMTR